MSEEKQEYDASITRRQTMTWKTIQLGAGDFHFLPVDDELHQPIAPHVLSIDCPCRPVRTVRPGAPDTFLIHKQIRAATLTQIKGVDGAKALAMLFGGTPARFNPQPGPQTEMMNAPLSVHIYGGAPAVDSSKTDD